MSRMQKKTRNPDITRNNQRRDREAWYFKKKTFEKQTKLRKNKIINTIKYRATFYNSPNSL